MFDLIFDPPWWLIAGLLVMGGYLFWSGNRKQDNTLRNVGAAALVLTLAVLAVAWFVDTPRETALDQTEELIEAVGTRDWAAFSALLDGRSSFWLYRGKRQLADGAQRSAERIGLRSVRIISMQADQNASRVTVNARVLSEQDIAPYPTPTDWRFEWQNSGSGWYLGRIEYLSNPNLTPELVERQLSPPRE